jgi:predicted nucleic acid-binding protein
MQMFVADTSVWIEFFRNADSPHTRLMRVAISGNQVIVPDLILLEILRGLPNQQLAGRIEKMMLEFDMIVLGGREMARSAAANYRLLRSKGITPRGSIDLLIATWCIENKIPLLHKDRDFTIMEGHLGLPVVSVMN